MLHTVVQNDSAARIIDQDIQRAVASYRCPDHVLRNRLVGEITRMHQRACMGFRRQSIRCRIDPGLVKVRDQQLRTFGPETLGDRKANALRSAGHHRNSSVKLARHTLS
jgi:hypothetical protein